MLVRRFKRIMWTSVLVSCVPAACLNARQADDPPGARWHGSYERAMEQARLERKLMLVHFYDPEEPHDNDLLVIDYFNTQRWAEYGQRLVMVRVPVWWEASIAGQHQQLIQHAAFAELRGQCGLVVIDLTDPDSGNYGHVVSVIPLAGGRNITARQLDVLLDLPSGSLTQRTLIFAVRIHEEEPHSTSGRLSQLLASQAESHSLHQASIRRQGHHNWNQRFHSINGQLPDGLVVQEVCAESWPGEGLLDAAIECVRSWRHSPGHWNAVRRAHTVYGYDMKRGSNGVWYATGIFGNRGA